MTFNAVDNHEKETSKKSDYPYFVQSQVRTPPPPGFPIDNKAVFYGSNRAGAESAPPLSLGSELMNNSTSFTSNLDNLSDLRFMLRPTTDNNIEKNPGTTSSNNDIQVASPNGRTSSYVNLAAALGEGLAESMGDSLEEVEISGNLHGRIKESDSAKVNIDFNNNGGNTKTFNIDMVMDNYSRQSRHSLTRLVGSSNNGFTPDSRQFLQQKMMEEYRNKASDLTSLRTLEDTISSTTNGNSITSANNQHETTTSNGLPEEFAKQMDMLSMGTRIGRASAPPQFFDNGFSQFALGTNSSTLKKQTTSSLQQRASELRGIQHIEPPTPSPAQMSIDFSNSISQTTIQRSETRTPSQHLVNESETMKQLRPFIWNSSSQPNQPSRALAIFGVSQFSISEIRSLCEAFGSLLYFRSEFCVSRNVIFTAYHDLRSACHASKELKNYLRKMASSNNLDDSDDAKGKDGLHVVFSVSLLSSSERDESSLLFSNLPFGVDKEQVYQIMASFGAILSISECAPDVDITASTGPSYLVKFYDVQDANHCILEIQSTKPWGETASIRTQKRAESDRKRGQNLLSLISQWRMSSKNSSQQSVVSSVTAHTQSPPSVSSRTVTDEKLKSNPNCNVSTSSTQSTTPPLSFLPQAPQLVIGPDGQYSYVVVQPQAYQASPPQYIQQATIVPSHHRSHQPPTQHVPQPQYIFDGQNYWVQPSPREHHLTNPHIAGYHHVQQSQPVTYQVLPVYPTALNQNMHNDPGRNVQSQNFVHNAPKAASKENGNSDTNQRNVLDIDAVKQGWDSRTSLMIRNIPNKYTRSMLLSEFKESNHGPGKIDFFYLPIDFRNKCNRGYAFINFVNYRDIVSFYDTYNGKGWKTFKSDKICEITYARIQGKSSMMKRFQNSALMDKDPEYRPVIFNDKGEVCSPNDSEA